MKKEWSNKWNSSTQPRKQRKYRANAPLHIKKKFLRANLEEKLREQIGKRSATLKKGDEIVIKRGQHNGKIGKIVAIQINKSTVHIDTLKEKKANGQEYIIPVHASNIQIIKLNLDDKKRIDKNNKKTKTVQPEKKTIPKKENKEKTAKKETKKEIKDKKSE